LRKVFKRLKLGLNLARKVSVFNARICKVFILNGLFTSWARVKTSGKAVGLADGLDLFEVVHGVDEVEGAPLTGGNGAEDLVSDGPGAGAKEGFGLVNESVEFLQFEVQGGGKLRAAERSEEQRRGNAGGRLASCWKVAEVKEGDLAESLSYGGARLGRAGLGDASFKGKAGEPVGEEQMLDDLLNAPADGRPRRGELGLMYLEGKDGGGDTGFKGGELGGHEGASGRTKTSNIRRRSPSGMTNK
jgi:hypothetical protein